MPLTVDWNSFYGGEEVAYVRHRYPLPIDGYVCSRCEAVKPRHNCIDLTCSCDCPELALKEEEAEGEIFDRSPFHGRRRDVDEVQFVRMALPRYAERRGMKGHSIRRFGFPSPQSVQPQFWRASLKLHERLLSMIGSRVRPWKRQELTEMQKADAQLTSELRSVYAASKRLASEFKIPLHGSQQKWRVLQCVIGGQVDAYVIAGMTGLPPKHVSAWLSVLSGQGLIERAGEWRNHKVGHSFVIWKPNMEAIAEVNKQGRLQNAPSVRSTEVDKCLALPIGGMDEFTPDCEPKRYANRLRTRLSMGSAAIKWRWSVKLTEAETVCVTKLGEWQRPATY